MGRAASGRWAEVTRPGCCGLTADWRAAVEGKAGARRVQPCCHHDSSARPPPPSPCVHRETGHAATEQTYCDRLVQDTPFLMGHGRLSEQQVDRIILQLNRYYPQILSNKDAEKFRNPKASLRVRLCDLLGHLQRSSERDCQEFYRALYMHAQPLHRSLPSRRASRNSDCTELDSGTASHELSDRGPMAFLACLGLAAGLALLLYCCPPDPKVLPRARRVLGFSPLIVDRHASRFLLAFLTDSLGGL